MPLFRDKTKIPFNPSTLYTLSNKHNIPQEEGSKVKDGLMKSVSMRALHGNWAQDTNYGKVMKRPFLSIEKK